VLNIGPLLFNLSHPAVQPRHFKMLFAALNRPHYPPFRFKIRSLVASDIGAFELLVGR
jgi:hypothetical protein